MRHLSKCLKPAGRIAPFMNPVVRLMVIWALLCSTLSNADHIEWDHGPGVKAKGNGCPNPQDIMYLSVGGSFSLIMTQMEIHLSGNSAPMSAKKECKFEVPATIDPGYYVSDMYTDVHYGFVRTDKTFGIISAKFDFLGNRFKYEDYIGLRGRRESNVPHTSMSNHSKLLSIFGELCQGRRHQDKFKGSLVTWAQRTRKEESILIQTDGMDLRLELESELIACPENGGPRVLPFR